MSRTKGLPVKPVHLFIALFVLALTMVGMLSNGSPANAGTTGQYYITGYSYWDNDPPGYDIAYPGVLHGKAGGQGTYADPITAAVKDTSGISRGTRFYVPNLRRYVIVEDYCAGCSGAWLDLWVDGSSNESVANQCMSAITGSHTAVRDPAEGYPVIAGPISGPGGCTKQYGDTVPSLTTDPTPPPATTPTPPPAPPTPTVTNLARLSDVSVRASSQNWNTGQTAKKAVDGVIAGAPNTPTAEWATTGGLAGSWIEVRWSSPVTVQEARLFDRPNSNDQILAGRLTFSDGTTVQVGSLNNAGAQSAVTFAAKRVTSVRFTVSRVSSTTRNVGLAEIQLLGWR